VISHVYRLVRDVAIAEELSQEVFLRVYRTRDYRPTAKFRSWLFRIATNLALNWLRDHRHEAHISAWIIRRPKPGCASPQSACPTWKSSW
jgi:RNA polymerase sigma-70 factor (ECF subfamily)